METRTEYDEKDIQNLLTKINASHPKDIPNLLQQYPNLTPTIKTVYNFVKNNAVVTACYALITDNITKLDPDQLRKILPDLKSKLQLSDSTPLIKCLSAILIAIPFSTECIARGSYKLKLPTDCYLNLSNANLFSAEFINGSLKYAQLIQTSFRCANLSKSDLSDTNLNQADFSDCNLTDSNLTNADFTAAKFDRATLTRTKFLELDQASLIDRDKLSLALDKLHQIIHHHPNVAALRSAIALDLHQKLNQLPTKEKVGVYNTAYKHPLFNTHRDLRGMRSFINTIHGWFTPKSDGRVGRNAIETRSQKILAD